MNKKSYFKSGQVGIIAVLVGVVIFTLGMAVAGRVVTDTRVAARSEEGARAHAAAEAAIEIAMSRSIQELQDIASGTPAPTWSDGELVTANYQVTALPAGNTTYDIGIIPEGEARTVWLVYLAENNNPNVTPFTANPYPENFLVGWDPAPGSPTGNRVEVTLYYSDTAASAEPVLVKRWFMASGQNFVTIDAPTATQIYYLVRVKAVTGSVSAYVVPDDTGPNFPIQEFEIVADGATLDGQIRRRSVGSRKVGEIPLFFDYVVANGGGNLAKQ